MTAVALAYGIASLMLVGGYRELARRRRWFDHPNERSSHRQATPRGAGIVFALLITLAAVLRAADQPALALSFALIFGTALTGWWDDLRSLAARYRFALYWLSGLGAALVTLPQLAEMAAASPLQFAVTAVAISLALVWLTNLYNFMDGINGIAGFEAIFVLGGALWLGTGSPFDTQLGALLWAVLFSVGGFLIWNFPNGRVFMGDAGSAYLGGLIGLLMLWSLQLDGPHLFSWLILLGVFIADTGYTLAVRVCTGQHWYQAHRSHAYQRLSDLLQSHVRVVILLSAINLLWLLPCAWLARTGSWSGFAVMLVAYAPLLASCHQLKAGIRTTTAV